MYLKAFKNKGLQKPLFLLYLYKKENFYVVDNFNYFNHHWSMY